LTDEAFEAKRQEMRESRSEHFRENGSFITEAAIQKKVRKTGDPYFVLQSSNVCSTQRSVCTVVFPTAEESEWALEIWRSIQPPSVKADA
jgi:hypothetical protein